MNHRARTRLQYTLDELQDQMMRPRARGRKTLRQTNHFTIIEPTVDGDGSPSRRQTLFIVPEKILLLVDEFRNTQQRDWVLGIDSSRPLKGSPLKYLLKSRKPDLAVHILGDYSRKCTSKSLEYTQNLAQGRFMIVVTRDPDAIARAPSGWAVEVRSDGHTYQLLHSNRSRKLVQLGGLKVDAMYALMCYPQARNLPKHDLNQFQLDVLDGVRIEAN